MSAILTRDERAVLEALDALSRGGGGLSPLPGWLLVSEAIFRSGLEQGAYREAVAALLRRRLVQVRTHQRPGSRGDAALIRRVPRGET